MHIDKPSNSKCVVSCSGKESKHGGSVSKFLPVFVLHLFSDEKICHKHSCTVGTIVCSVSQHACPFQHIGLEPKRHNQVACH